jgi:hypothetical protein
MVLASCGLPALLSIRRAPMSKCNCKTCGLLAMRDCDGKEARELLDEHRESGWVRHPNGDIKIARVFCYVDSPAFVGEAEKMHTAGEVVNSISALIDCDQWRRWRRGKSPKEHEDMSILEEVRSEQRHDRHEQRRHNRNNAIISAISTTTAIVALVVSVWSSWRSSPAKPATSVPDASQQAAPNFPPPP